MNLRDVIATLDQQPDEGIICARRPWSALSEATVTPPTAELGVPDTVKSAGFSYFLEVDVARETLQVLNDRPASPDDGVQLLIHYAEKDAYPDWVYDK